MRRTISIVFSGVMEAFPCVGGSAGSARAAGYFDQHLVAFHAQRIRAQRLRGGTALGLTGGNVEASLVHGTVDVFALDIAVGEVGELVRANVARGVASPVHRKHRDLMPFALARQ